MDIARMGATRRSNKQAGSNLSMRVDLAFRFRLYCSKNGEDF